uniref:Immunoglobulin V-set domain-containing protein n=1 Tax=Oryzias melastigma TaxID=30732 RepID=A0A3B3D627_ORYME
QKSHRPFCLTEAAGILPDGPLNAAVGGSVMFTTSLTEADGPFDAVTWNFNATILITSYQSGSSLIPPAYQDRITLFPSTASLELRDLTLEDGGEYSVNVFPDKGGRIKLDIYGNVYIILFQSDLLLLWFLAVLHLDEQQL